MEDTFLLVCWILTTWFVTRIVVRAFFSNNEAELREKLVKYVDEVTHRVEVEIQDGMHYWFDKDDQEFIAQGRDLSELIDRTKQRFPTHLFFFRIKENDYVLSAKTEWKPVPVKLPLN